VAPVLVAATTLARLTLGGCTSCADND
jgi:hypothetical protein